MFGMHVDVRDVESSSKLYIPNCVHSMCRSFYQRDCWCCKRDLGICFKTKQRCVSSPLCPPLNFKTN
ncbi:unnamed protein product [Thlaspi arvense]|uniref:Embryo surrounding factor 1 brassicaceae domain-containing protein n=1 Tax=Thlaspi arvense TaxID=13288 RepID=A0AAU9RDV7_THLAR|nr:unnamed protein product [Thlaspi arvense]